MKAVKDLKGCHREYRVSCDIVEANTASDRPYSVTALSPSHANTAKDPTGSPCITSVRPSL